MNLTQIVISGVIYFVMTSTLFASADNPYLSASQQSEQVGTRYLNAYIEQDWDVLSELLAEESKFDDPTANLVFGPVVQQGKAQIMKYFVENYLDFDMSIVINETFFSGNIAMFNVSLDWSFQNEGRQINIHKMPMMVVLRIEEGKVLEHRDYVIYDKLLNALNEG